MPIVKVSARRYETHMRLEIIKLTGNKQRISAFIQCLLPDSIRQLEQLKRLRATFFKNVVLISTSNLSINLKYGLYRFREKNIEKCKISLLFCKKSFENSTFSCCETVVRPKKFCINFAKKKTLENNSFLENSDQPVGIKFQKKKRYQEIPNFICV